MFFVTVFSVTLNIFDYYNMNIITKFSVQPPLRIRNTMLRNSIPSARHPSRIQSHRPSGTNDAIRRSIVCANYYGGGAVMATRPI